MWERFTYFGTMWGGLLAGWFVVMFLWLKLANGNVGVPFGLFNLVCWVGTFAVAMRWTYRRFSL